MTVRRRFKNGFLSILRISLLYAACAACCLPQLLHAQDSPAFDTRYAAQEKQTLRDTVIKTAKQYAGVPYRYGGVSTSGMDCSGFIYTVAREAAGIQLPRTAAAMYSFCRIVPDDKKEPGDILFFKDGGKITHAGLYLGNNQFIHAASEGPSTGVIVSSLNKPSWRKRYTACGQFLPPEGKTEKAAVSQPAPEKPAVQPASEKAPEPTRPASGTGTAAPSHKEPHSEAEASFIDNTAFDFSGRIAWNFYTADGFMLNIRGAYFQVHARYRAWKVQPGFAAEIRIEPRMHIVQFPLLLTLSVPHGFCVYAGPVFTAGEPHLIGKSDPIKASVFPGVFGISWHSRGLQTGATRVSFVQDISWTVFNKPDNSALSLQDSIIGGLVFSTGMHVTVPAKHLFK